MSGVKHTPGLWVWKQSDCGEHESLVVSGTLNGFVLWPETELGSYGLSSREWCEVSEANARLIATILEDTGSPAHMRVAVELRGE